MLYAVIFRNRAEELVIRAIEDSSIEEAIETVVSQWNKDYEGTKEECEYPLSGASAVPIKSGEGIYHA